MAVRSLSSEMWRRVVWYICTDVSDEPAGFICTMLYTRRQWPSLKRHFRYPNHRSWRFRSSGAWGCVVGRKASDTSNVSQLFPSSRSSSSKVLKMNARACFDSNRLLTSCRVPGDVKLDCSILNSACFVPVLSVRHSVRSAKMPQIWGKIKGQHKSSPWSTFVIKK